MGHLSVLELDDLNAKCEVYTSESDFKAVNRLLSMILMVCGHVYINCSKKSKLFYIAVQDISYCC